MKADAQTEGEVKASLQRLTDAFAKRNLKGFLECFASDVDVVLYGTGADEKRIGLEQIRAQVERDWSQSETAAMAFTWTSVSAAGMVAWVAVDGAFKFRVGGQDIALAARISFVLEKRAAKWLIVHAHFSTPASGQEEGQSF
jgi:uncharacterized protein (TIGR02246 family)